MKSKGTLVCMHHDLKDYMFSTIPPVKFHDALLHGTTKFIFKLCIDNLYWLSQGSDLIWENVLSAYLLHMMSLAPKVLRFSETIMCSSSTYWSMWGILTFLHQLPSRWFCSAHLECHRNILLFPTTDLLSFPIMLWITKDNRNFHESRPNNILAFPRYLRW